MAGMVAMETMGTNKKHNNPKMDPPTCTCSSRDNVAAKKSSKDLKNSPSCLPPSPSIMASHRTVSVQAEGQVEAWPDRFNLTITVTSTKQKLDEAQLSVKRRSDYIIQVLRNHDFKGKRLNIFEEITRLPCSNGSSEVEHQVKCIVKIEGDEMEKVLRVKNLLLQKMDASVLYSNISCYHSSGYKAKKR